MNHHTGTTGGSVNCAGQTRAMGPSLTYNLSPTISSAESLSNKKGKKKKKTHITIKLLAISSNCESCGNSPGDELDVLGFLFLFFS